jgi:hypothetical protein
MSSKATLRRIVLVELSALSFGFLTVMSGTPTSAVATTLAATVGPNGETSLTLVGDTATAGVVVKMVVTCNDTSTKTDAIGLSARETINAAVIGFQQV